MANYVVPPALLEPYLPKGVELDTFDSKTFVSLVGFMFKKTSLFGISIPFFGTFEEINLRFYVKRIEGPTIKRGVVFINETVPHKIVAWLANKLYKEHYISIPTRNKISMNENNKVVHYEWKINNKWNHLGVWAEMEKDEMKPDSLEEFIFEHYYGYTKINSHQTQEYKVNHPKWQINKVKNHEVDCDFASRYGDDFAFLKNQTPHSVIIAEGSPVTVDWKRTTI